MHITKELSEAAAAIKEGIPVFFRRKEGDIFKVTMQDGHFLMHGPFGPLIMNLRNSNGGHFEIRET